MRIPLIKFGEFLMSRPSGHEAAQIMTGSYAPANESETIELDFEGVFATGPSWLHEVVIGLQSVFPKNKIVVLDRGNNSVLESLKFIDLK